jgi:NAD(P)H dehydrogenase (quinone)
MHALIVIAHPNPKSLTHSVAAHIADGVTGTGAENSFEIADLTAEGFDPRFTETDIAVHLRQATPTADVVGEQARLDRADALVLVYPVYWWSMPGLLKGWIDRVFANGWAYDESADGQLTRNLGRLRVHLVAIGGADLRTYARHGYFGAMKTQIDHGTFGWCGAKVTTSELLVSAPLDPDTHLETARRIGRNLFAPSEQENQAA